jgi:hypothetical protein
MCLCVCVVYVCYYYVFVLLFTIVCLVMGVLGHPPSLENQILNEHQLRRGQAERTQQEQSRGFHGVNVAHWGVQP